MTQVFVVVAASNILAFIIRDLGQPALIGWVIQVLAALVLPHTVTDADIPRVHCSCNLCCLQS